MSAPSEVRAPLVRRALPGLLFVLLVVAAYSPTLFARRNFAGRDLLVYNLPIEKAIHDSRSRGAVPVWISEISGGRPLGANPNAGVLYPVRPLLSLLPFPAAMRVYPVLHWAAAGLGMLLLLRSIGGSRSAAWIGAVTYAFSGVAVSEVFYTNYQPGMTLLPWVVVVNTPAALRFETSSPDPTWLFVLRGFWGYRDVRVDSIPVETAPAQIAFSAVPLPAGRHTVDWTERLPGSEMSRWGPALFALVMAGLLVRDRSRA